MKSRKNINTFYLFSLLILCQCTQSEKKPSLPFIGEKRVVSGDTIYHTIGDFKLIDQNGEFINNETTKGKIYIANFFFATCQSICPKMSSNLVWVQKKYLNNDSILILSHSVNPIHDSVEVLKQYASSYGILSNKWHLLTGDKKTIYDLAKDSYLVNALEDDGSAEGFLHSQLFLLVDGKSRIRGMYEGTDSLSVIQMVNDIEILRAENLK